MKKCKFYSLVNIDGKVCVMLQHGYTDGEFNYYKSPYRSRKWYVICPETGVAIWNAESMKVCAAVAHDEFTRSEVARVKGGGRGERWAREFERCIAEYEAEHKEVNA